MSTRNQPARQQSGANPMIIVGVVVAVLALAAVAVFVTAGDDDAGVTADGTSEAELESQYGIVTVDGSSLSPAGEGDDPAAGTTAPTIVSERSEGTVRVEPGAEDQPVMLVFLAHWCPHCQRELPRLVEMQESGAFDDIRTVAVLTSTAADQDNFPPSTWLDDEGWTGDRFYDDEDSRAAQAYGLSSFPMMTFLDADGQVVQRLSGEQDPATVEAAVAAATS